MSDRRKDRFYFSGLFKRNMASRWWRAVLSLVCVLSFLPGLAAAAQGAVAYIPWFDGEDYNNTTYNEIMVIDLLSGNIVKKIRVGESPSGVAVSRAGDRVFVANSGSDTVSVIDAKSLTVIAEIPVGDVPLFVMPSADGARIYVGNAGDNTISVIDPNTFAVIGLIPLAYRPSQIVEDIQRNRLLVGHYPDRYISEVDLITLQVKTPIYTPGRIIAVTPDDSAVVGGWLLEAYRLDPISLSAGVSLGLGAFINEIVPDKRNNVLFSVVSLSGMFVLNPDTLEVINSLYLPEITHGFGLSPDGTLGLSVPEDNLAFCFPLIPCEPQFLPESAYVIDVDRQEVIREIELGRGGSLIRGHYFIGPNFYDPDAYDIPTLSRMGFVVLMMLLSGLALGALSRRVKTG